MLFNPACYEKYGKESAAFACFICDVPVIATDFSPCLGMCMVPTLL